MALIRNEVLEASIRILSPATRQLLAARLDSRKILLTSKGIHRDWRGLAVQAQLDVGTINSGLISFTEHCFQLWRKNPGTVGQLWAFLEAMDRFDVIDDTRQMIYEDYDRVQSEVPGRAEIVPPSMDEDRVMDANVLTTDDIKNMRLGLGLQHYDALVLYADEDIDFVQQMIEQLESNYGLKLCLKDRDLIGGLQFETEAVVRLITERCSRVIVVLSPEFLASNVNKYFTSFAHALSVDQRRRIVIPCMFKPCEKPTIISFCHSLDYYRAIGYWNYWEKLKASLMIHTRAIKSSTSMENQCRIQEITGPSSASAHESQAVESPSQSRSFLKTFALRIGDSTGKSKSRSSSSDSSQHQKSKVGSPKSNGTALEHVMTHDANGNACSSAIVINGRSETTGHRYSSSSASMESGDFMNMVGSLPDVPETPPLSPVSPMSTTSSRALLLPGETTPSPKSSSRFFDKIFRGKHKRKDYG